MMGLLEKADAWLARVTMPGHHSTEKWHCLDCSWHTALEYYMVLNDLWDQSGGGWGMLCIDCLEKRLGRRLTPSDFTHCEVNTRPWYRTPRLRDRLGIEDPVLGLRIA